MGKTPFIASCLVHGIEVPGRSEGELSKGGTAQQHLEWDLALPMEGICPRDKGLLPPAAACQPEMVSECR